jgi:hypothetical protein
MPRVPDPEYVLVHAVGLCVLNWWRVEASIADLFLAVLRLPGSTDESKLDQIPLVEEKLNAVDAAVGRFGFAKGLNQKWARLRDSIGEKYKAVGAIARISIQAAQMDLTAPDILVRNVPMAALLRRHKKLHLSEIDAYASSFARLADDIVTLRLEVQKALSKMPSS